MKLFIKVFLLALVGMVLFSGLLLAAKKVAEGPVKPALVQFVPDKIVVIVTDGPAIYATKPNIDVAKDPKKIIDRWIEQQKLYKKYKFVEAKVRVYDEESKQGEEKTTISVFGAAFENVKIGNHVEISAVKEGYQDIDYVLPKIIAYSSDQWIILWFGLVKKPLIKKF